MTTDPTPLQERLWDALHTHRPRLTDTELHAGGAVDRIVLGRIGDVTDALAPIIAAEVRKAKAEALREAADFWQDTADHNTPADIEPEWLRERATEYETGDQA